MKFVRFGAHLPERLNLRAKHGPVFQAQVEYQRTLAVLIAHYSFLLLRRPHKFLNPEIRAYHRAALKRLFRVIDTRDVIAGVRIQLRRMRQTRMLRPGRI